MKFQKMLVSIQGHLEMARVLLVEAETCLKTPGAFQGCIQNPVLGHAAFFAICASFRALEHYDSNLLWENVRTPLFMFRVSKKGTLKGRDDLDLLQKHISLSMQTGAHAMPIFRNRKGAQDALDDDTNFGNLCFCLEEAIEHLLHMVSFMEYRAEAQERKNKTRDNAVSYSVLSDMRPDAVAAIKVALERGVSIDDIYWRGYHDDGRKLVASLFANAAQHILDGGEHENPD